MTEENTTDETQLQGGEGSSISACSLTPETDAIIACEEDRDGMTYRLIDKCRALEAERDEIQKSLSFNTLVWEDRLAKSEISAKKMGPAKSLLRRVSYGQEDPQKAITELQRILLENVQSFPHMTRTT